jgi:lipid A oxidase
VRSFWRCFLLPAWPVQALFAPLQWLARVSCAFLARGLFLLTRPIAPFLLSGKGKCSFAGVFIVETVGAVLLIARWSGPACRATFAALAALAPALGTDAARAELQAALYGGFSESFDSDITLKQPNGTNVTLNSVPWDGASFDDPIYWGARGIYWLEGHPNWGLMVDYNHAKVIAGQGAVVGVSGTRDGAPVGPRDRVGNTFDIMEFTHGLNQIFAGAMYRWEHEHWTPHVGFGVGASFPHVEVRRTGSTVRTYDYQLTGIAVEGLVGIEYRLSPRLSAFGDYSSASPATMPI